MRILIWALIFSLVFLSSGFTCAEEVKEERKSGGENAALTGALFVADF